MKAKQNTDYRKQLDDLKDLAQKVSTTNERFQKSSSDLIAKTSEVRRRLASKA